MVAIIDEIDLVRNLLITKGPDYNLDDLVSNDNISLKEPENIHEFPSIQLSKMGASEETYLGDLGYEGKENIQLTSVRLILRTRENLSRKLGTSYYKNENLINEMRKRVKQLMFDNRNYNVADSNYNIVISLMSGDADGLGIIRASPIYQISLMYMIQFQMKY